MNQHLVQRINTKVDSLIVQLLAKDAEGLCSLGGTVEEVAAFISMKRADYQACKDELLARVIVDATMDSLQ